MTGLFWDWDLEVHSGLVVGSKPYQEDKERDGNSHEQGKRLRGPETLNVVHSRVKVLWRDACKSAPDEFRTSQ